MGDLANMTDNDGRVNGNRLLRWLRRRAADRRRDQERCVVMNDRHMAGVYQATAMVYEAMADDLESELTPPDYPEDDGYDSSAFMSGPHDPHKRSPGDDDEEVDLDDPALTGGPEEERQT